MAHEAHDAQESHEPHDINFHFRKNGISNFVTILKRFLDNFVSLPLCLLGLMGGSGSAGNEYFELLNSIELGIITCLTNASIVTLLIQLI